MEKKFEADIEREIWMALLEIEEERAKGFKLIAVNTCLCGKFHPNRTYQNEEGFKFTRGRMCDVKWDID